MVRPKYNFCKRNKKHEEDYDIEYVKLFCKSFSYEECDNLFEEWGNI